MPTTFAFCLLTSAFTSPVSSIASLSLAHVAELADAYGSGPYGATRGGSSPLVSRSGMESVFTQKEPGTIQRLFARIAHRYDLANSLLSLGCDSLWRANVAARVRRWSPADILDLATGSGVLAHEIRRQTPRARIVGADFCAPMLTLARQRGITELVVADALALPFLDERFDVVTIAFGLRNMASYETALGEVRRVLRTGGHVLILDFSLPRPPLRYLYRFYLHRILPVLAGWVTGEPEAYRYFSGTIEDFPKDEAMLELLRSCGLANCDAKPLTMGIVTVYTGQKV
jgi:demethylmenaquinone methyltransferase / 2-methoxy-6-polyprenyl-1,4-benzoquinol methylase